MLKYIRKNSGGIISILIIGAIALVFIFWGIGGQDTGTTEEIKIDGQPVSQYTYAELLNNVSDQMRSEKAGAPLTQPEELSARRQALGYLVDRQNLLTLAKGTGRQVSVQAINQAVKTNPLFQVDGRFNLKTYEDVVPRVFKRTLATFEANLAEDLLVNEMETFLKSLSFAPKDAILDDYQFTDDKLTLDYVYFPEKIFQSDTEPTEEQILSYYRDNQEKWRSPAKANLEYVEIDISDYNDQVEVTEADLEDAYLEERESLSKPEEAEASQILIRFPSLTPTPEEKAATAERAKIAQERAKTEDFKTLATEISEDTNTAKNGGSLGTVRRGQNLPQVEDAIFGSAKDNPGQVVGPVESLFGYHLIVVDSYSPAHQPTIEEAKDELTAIVTQRKARRLAVDKIEDLIDIMPTSNLNASVFAETAKSVGLEPKETGLFSDPSDAPPFLAEDNDLVNAALSTPLGQLGEPVDNPEHIILYTPIEKLDSFIRPLDDESVRPEVVAAWREDMAQKTAQEAAQAFIDSSEGTDWAGMLAALPEGVETGTTDPFARMQFFSAGAYLTEAEPNSFLAQFFKLGQEGDLIDGPIRIDSASNKGYLVLAVSGYIPADNSGLDEPALRNLQSTAKAALANSAYTYWSAKRRSQAKIQLPQGLQAMIEGRDLIESAD
jgi:peptidyl-prolyl cis-trans isomerase D